MGTLFSRYLLDGSRFGYGGRGRNRTYNLSIKSRMLCQLSYASEGCARIGDPVKPDRSACVFLTRFKKYITLCEPFDSKQTLPLEGKGQSAFDSARCLREVENAAIAGHKRPIALR
jgi:hypothetical protein